MGTNYYGPSTQALNVTKAGTGTGTVTSNPMGINCGADCSESYAYNTSVTLTAAPSGGSTFAGWSGACTGTGSCVVSMTVARSVTATFNPPSAQALNVTKAGTGTGTVTSNPVGINCGADCSEPYAYNTSVTLTAAPSGGSTFAGWSGACTGTGSCVVSMTAARSVTATFNPPGAQALNVTKAGTGTGTVSSNPVGINCGADCSEPYTYNTSVTLTATPSGGSTFAGWSGACTGTGSCVVSMSAARSVTATFTSSSGSGNFFTVNPCRVIDTRNPNGPRGGPALSAGSDRTFTIAGACDIPSSAKAISVNIAVTGAMVGGNLRLHPGGTSVPLISSINYAAGVTRSNNAIVRLNVSGQLAVYTDQSAGSAHFILDVNGYFQ